MSAVVQGRRRRHELANEPRGSRELQRDRAFLRPRQHLGQAHAADVIGDDDDGGAARVEPLDGTDAAERFVTEVGEPCHLVAERFFETGDAAQLVTDLEHLERLVGGADRVQPLAQAVFERHGRNGARL